MTSLVAPRPDMPGYSSVDMDDVHTPSSDFSFYSAAMGPNSGLFSFASHTGPSSDPLSGSSWATPEDGTQNFPQEYLDNGSSQPGASEDFTFSLDGQVTPKGQVSSHAMDDLQNKWTGVPSSTTTVAAPVGGEPMRRGTSRTSNGSRKHRVSKPASKSRMSTSSAASHVSSRMSSLDVAGNASLFANGSTQTAGQMDVNTCLFLDPEASGVSPQALYPDMTMDFGMGVSSAGFSSPTQDMASMHVVPSHMQLDPDASLASHSPSASWASLSTPESHLTSPAGSPEEAWLPDPLLASPPRSDDGSPSLHNHLRVDGKITNQDMMANDLPGSMLTVVGDDYGLPAPYASRRPGNDGESARDHPLYKNAAPASDGLYHCPWEGQASCNHKPEKLKCNYDKFVDSHLKPYRCKDPSCDNARFSSTACLLRHEREAHAMHGHGDKPFQCSYDGCDRSMPGNGFPRQWNLRDHMRRVHNDNRVPGSPNGIAQAQPTSSTASSTKGRKRKDTTSSKTSVSGRKAAAKAAAVEAAAQEAQSMKPLIEEYMSHHKTLGSLIAGLDKPTEAAKNVQLIKEVQNRLTSMSQISMSLNPSCQAPMQSHMTPRRSYTTG